jgi:hypothetical protein
MKHKARLANYQIKKNVKQKRFRNQLEKYE